MKKQLNTIKLIAFFSAIAFNAPAQKNGITISPLNAAYYANTSLFLQGYMGMGYERNVGDYISLKIEVNQGFQLLYNVTGGNFLQDMGNNYQKSVSVYNPTSSYNTDVYYHWNVPAFEINYQAKFFFSGNDKTGAYLASGIGFRSIKYQLHIGDVTGYEYSDYVPADLQAVDGYKQTLTIIPLTLRFGVRSDLKGFYPDFNMGFSYNFGHNKSISNETINNPPYELKVPKISPVTITASLCFGIGW